MSGKQAGQLMTQRRFWPLFVLLQTGTFNDNILKNAFEANEDKGVVRVKASCPNNVWTARIEDDGEGIKLEDINNIFKPFFTTRSKGTGLGLAYASQVINAHSGNITAENRGEGGAVFLVEIPTA